MTFSDDNALVRRHRINQFATYEIQVSDFKRIREVAGSIGTDLTFAVAAASVCATLIITLSTVTIQGERRFNIFLIATGLSFIAMLLFGIRWWRQRGELEKLMSRIEADLGVGPLGDERNPIGQAALDVLPLVAAPQSAQPPPAMVTQKETGEIQVDIQENMAAPQPAVLAKPEPSERR